ncbi:MAG: SPFH domain-containing protein [Saprospiraceae bacterium]|nr:SPFH domain-containing protein [Saprospiraceae bacterium]HRG68056.1 SPFH domain-containing protein [Saprospiraceae bacterium]
MDEKVFKPVSGWLLLLFAFGLILAIVFLEDPIYKIISGFVLALVLLGFIIVNPNNSKVMTLFGKYVGSIKQDGFYWANPFFLKRNLSLRARNFESERLKVNDKRGNPIQIGVILVWKVKNTFKAQFEVEDYAHFVKVQTDAAVRKLAGSFSYDHVDDHQEITLRSEESEVNRVLEKELHERLQIAGIEVLEARIGYLAYAPEIAAAMLKRQQAEAIVSARYKIVEGAIGMVDGALKQLEDKGIVKMDDHEKVKLVSNLMVVLCSDKETVPIVEATA